MNINITIERLEVYVGDDLSEVLDAVQSLREATMARITDVTAMLDAMNQVTNQIASNVQTVVTNEAAQLAEIQALKDQIAAGSPVTQEQLDELAATMQSRVSALESVRDSLGAIAADPNNPTPEPPPIEVPGEEGTDTGTGEEGGGGNPQTEG